MLLCRNLPPETSRFHQEASGKHQSHIHAGIDKLDQYQLGGYELLRRKVILNPCFHNYCI